MGWATVPAPELGRVCPLNNHGRYTFMTRRQYLTHETRIGMFLVPFAVAVFLDQRYDPFNRGS